MIKYLFFYGGYKFCGEENFLVLKKVYLSLVELILRVG